MNNLLRGGLILSLFLWLAACRSEHTVYGESYDHSYETEYTYVEEVTTGFVFEPELEAFTITDSFGLNSEVSPSLAMAIDPYVDNGWFEIAWLAHSWDDYWVEYYISDNPSLDNASYIGSQLCGLGFACEDDGLQFCRYTSDYGLRCDTGEEHTAYIDHLVHVIPQTLYFILQVCDLNFEYCEYQFEPVLMY